MSESLVESPESDTLKLSPDQEKELIEIIARDWETDDAARVQSFRDMAEGLRLYYGIRAKKEFPFPGCANFHVPLTRTISDTLHSNVMGSLDSNKPYSCNPIGPEDVPKARKTEKLLNWQFNTQIDYLELADKAVQSALVYRKAPIKVAYCVERDVNGKVVREGLRAWVLPVERFLTPADAGSTNVQEMDHVIQEIPMTRSDLKKRMADKKSGWKKISDEELKRIGIHSTKNDRDAQDDLANIRDLLTGTDPLALGSNPNKNYGTVLEWYGYFDANKDGVDEPVMAVILKEARKVLKVVNQKRSRPFAIITVSDVLHKGEGESVADVIGPVNTEVNSTHNQKSDSNTLRNIPYFFYDPIAGFNPNGITLTPGTGIPVNGNPAQAVYFPPMNGNVPEMYQEEQMLFSYGERVWGAGANTQGVMNTKRSTATEIAAVDRRAGIRFLTIFNRVRRGFREVGKLALELDREFMPPELQVRINGIDQDQPVFETVKRSDLMAELDVMVNGNSILDDQAEKSEMFQAYQIGLANPLISGDIMSFYQLTRDLYVKLGIKRVDAYVRKPADTVPRRPDEEHNLFLQEEYLGPHAMENFNEHIEGHAAIINDPAKFKLFSKAGQQMLIKHLNETLWMKAAVERMQMLQQASLVNQTLGQSQMTGTIPGVGAPGQSQQAAQSPIGQADAARRQP